LTSHSFHQPPREPASVATRRAYN